MNTATASSGFTQVGSPGLRPRDSNGWGPGMALALGVHLMLLAALAIGVHWKINNPEAIEAEMWDKIPTAVAPEPPPPPPEPEKPAEKVAEPTPPVEEAPQEAIPDLVVSKKLTKKEHKKPKKREPVEVFDTTPPKLTTKLEKVPEPKKAPAAPAPEKPVVSKVTKPDTSGKAAAEREAQRNAHMQRMMNELGALGTSSAGPSAAYAARIVTEVKKHSRYTEVVSGNPEAVIEVRCGPSGRIISYKLIQKSGVPSWDDAVVRAIEDTQTLPADENGKVPPVIQIGFRPKDQS